MASTMSKKRGRSTRSGNSPRPKQVPLDAAQMKQLVKEAVREVLQEERQFGQLPGPQQQGNGDWLEEARRIREQTPMGTPSSDILRVLREERASR